MPNAGGRLYASRPWTALAAAWRAVGRYVSRAAVHSRTNCAALERDLFGGLYTYSSKNDDDLPAVEHLIRGNVDIRSNVDAQY
jgi:hypothetical protein